MSKSDRLKAEIAFHEKMFFTSLALTLAVIGWTIEKADVTGDLMLIGAAMCSGLTSAFGIWNYRQIRTLLEKLEDA